MKSAGSIFPGYEFPVTPPPLQGGEREAKNVFLAQFHLGKLFFPFPYVQNKTLPTPSSCRALAGRAIDIQGTLGTITINYYS